MPEQHPDFDPETLDGGSGLVGVSSLAVEGGLLAGEEADIELRRLADEDDLGAADEVAKKKLGVVFWIAAGWVILLALLALLAPVLPGLADPVEQPRGTDALLEKSLPPLSTRVDGDLAVLGTDNLGRDQLSRVIYGARVSLAVGFGSVFLGTLIGGTIGLMAGYFRGRLDTGFMAAMDILLAFPALLLALSIVAIRGKGLVNALIALTVVAIPTIARLTRANTLVFSQREFVVAARTLGASHTRVITKEILPNTFLALLPFIPLGIAVAIAAEGALAYLGQSVELPDPSWGAMISEGRPQLDEGNWWVPMVPIAFLVVTLISLNLVGDRLREYFGIKEGSL